MRAQRPPHLSETIDATAEKLSFEDRTFEAAMATFTIHQWPDLARGLAEIRWGACGPVVLLTCDPALLGRFRSSVEAPAVLRFEEALRHDLANGSWDREHGTLRSQPCFEGSLVHVAGTPR
jgi:hypothetical protein